MMLKKTVYRESGKYLLFGEEVSIPTDYEFLEAGIQGLTAKATKLCMEAKQGYYVVMEKAPDQEYASRIGALYPKPILAKAQQAYEARRAAEERREQLHQQAMALVDEMYPLMPSEVRRTIQASLPSEMDEARMAARVRWIAKERTRFWLATHHQVTGLAWWACCNRAEKEMDAQLRAWEVSYSTP